MKIENSLPCHQLPEVHPHNELQFTVATEEDFDDIMAMSQDIYGGLDYLPSRFQAWLQETNRTVILARKQDKVIALESVCVIDDGETMLVEGLRVAPQERGKGVAGVLLRFCSQLVKAKYPEVKVSRLTRDDQLGAKDFQKYRLITKQGILLVRFCAEDLKLRFAELGLNMGTAGDSVPPSSTPVRLEPAEVLQIFLNHGMMQDILPNGTIVQDWQPFKPLPSNMAILLKKDIDWMVDDITCPSMASLCTYPIPVPIGDDWYYLNIDMFGKDLDLALQQLLCHLKTHTDTLKGHVMCQVFLDPPLWRPMADFFKETLKVELVKEYTEQCVVESDVV
ncbi:histidine N-acetyltransferase [Brachyhypopomus gauderio]|uniref:histidine N-acetyltransferase n=1 Tax=Brachyhypopomus gauderio TaxID=698409 RepID=UPI0040416B01